MMTKRPQAANLLDVGYVHCGCLWDADDDWYEVVTCRYHTLLKDRAETAEAEVAQLRALGNDLIRLAHQSRLAELEELLVQHGLWPKENPDD